MMSGLKADYDRCDRPVRAEQQRRADGMNFRDYRERLWAAAHRGRSASDKTLHV
jgi:hypothetical protein